MKVTTLSLKMFIDSIHALDKAGEEVEKAADEWLKWQEWRAKGWSPNPDDVNWARSKLERKLMAYREQLSHTYDLQGDKGLVNFSPEVV